MSVRVVLAEGESIILDADPGDVKAEAGALVVRRDGKIIASFRRHLAWHEYTTD